MPYERGYDFEVESTFFKPEADRTYKVRFYEPPAHYQRKSEDGSLRWCHMWPILVDTSRDPKHPNWVALVFDSGNRAYKALKTLADDPDFGDPANYDVKLKKTGEGFQTQYEMNALPPKPMTDAQKVAAELADFDLDKLIEEALSPREAGAGKSQPSARKDAEADPFADE